MSRDVATTTYRFLHSEKHLSSESSATPHLQVGAPQARRLKGMLSLLCILTYHPDWEWMWMSSSRLVRAEVRTRRWCQDGLKGVKTASSGKKNIQSPNFQYVNLPILLMFITVLEHSWKKSEKGDPTLIRVEREWKSLLGLHWIRDTGCLFFSTIVCEEVKLFEICWKNGLLLIKRGNPVCQR